MAKGILTMTMIYGEVKSYLGTDFIRELETGTDIRITEAGDTRITGSVALNTIESYLNASGDVLGFLDNMYVNVEGAWENSTPYVKHSGTWKEPASIYIKQGSNWKRVY